MRVYISGPIDGADDKHENFYYVERFLASQGMDFINPLKESDKMPEADRHEHMRRDYQDILRCDAMTLLPGWAESRGCVSEVLMASNLELVISRAFIANGYKEKIVHLSPVRGSFTGIAYPPD